MTSIVKLIFLVFLIFICKTLPEVRQSTEKIILGNHKTYVPAAIKATSYYKDSLKTQNRLLKVFYRKNSVS